MLITYLLCARDVTSCQQSTTFCEALQKNRFVKQCTVKSYRFNEDSNFGGEICIINNYSIEYVDFYISL